MYKKMLIEIGIKKNGEEVYFYDAYLSDLKDDMGNIIKTILSKVKDVDEIIMFVSEDEELLDVKEIACTSKNCGEKLLETFKQLVKDYA